MEFLCYHRDRPGSVPLREELLEEHWSYMDRYATEMIARGPTLAGDGGTPTGSLHIVDLPDPAAARAFAFDEPNYQAGVYRDVLLRRLRDSDAARSAAASSGSGGSVTEGRANPVTSSVIERYPGCGSCPESLAGGA